MLNKVIKYVLGGISWGCVCSCVISMVGTSAMGYGWFLESGHSYTAQVLASVIVGIGWVLPALVYESERLSRGIQMLIHFSVGLGVFFPTAFYMDWISGDIGMKGIIIEMLSVVAFSLLIWIGFYFYYRREARQMNVYLQKKREQEKI